MPITNAQPPVTALTITSVLLTSHPFQHSLNLLRPMSFTLEMFFGYSSHASVLATVCFRLILLR